MTTSQERSIGKHLVPHVLREQNGGSTPSSTEWLLDSGSSHHVTIDLQNLSLHSKYDDNGDIMIGNGTSLCITHTGFSKLCSPS